MSNSLPKSVQDLIQSFTRLPGIGPKTAQRLAMHLLQSSEGLSNDLAASIQNLKRSTTLCSDCWHLTSKNPCSICEDNYRDRTILCVVEDSADLIALEKTGTYKGLYHVLHGALSPIDGIGPEELKIAELMDRVDHLLSSEEHRLHEVILSTNPTMEGEATANYLLKWLKPFGIRVTRIARGLPSGADIEYADDLTLQRALEGRHEF